MCNSDLRRESANCVGRIFVGFTKIVRYITDAMASPANVISIILNTNRRDDTLQCLESLQGNTYGSHRAIVLDNASTDGSVEAIHQAFSEVEVIRLTSNLGYAGNNNAGIRQALNENPEWILVLNEDTVLDPECLSHMVAAGDGDPRIGIVGPMVYHFDNPTVIQSAGGMLSRYWEARHISENEPDRGLFSKPRDVDWISGCCIMLRSEMIEQIGLIDERYFYYWEETELCIRARKHGWRIVHAPHARIRHKGVQVDYRPPPSVTYYATRNRLLTLSKHQAPLIVRLIAWLRLIRTLLSWTIRPKWKSMRLHRDAMLRGMMDFLFRRWGRMRGNLK